MSVIRFIQKNKYTLLAFALLVLPYLALGQATGWVTCSGVDCNWNSFVGMISSVMRNLYILAFSIAVIFIAYAGFLLVTSGGDAGKRGRAKTIFINVIIGFVIMFFSYAFVVYMLKTLGVNTGFFQLLQF